MFDSSGRMKQVFSLAASIPTGTNTIGAISNAFALDSTLVSVGLLLNSLVSATVHCDTGAVVVSSSALPTGASTSALQTTGNTSLASLVASVTKANTDAVTVSSSVLPTGASTSALQTAGNTSLASLVSALIKANTDAVTITSSVLPTAASTSALQTSGNASLATLTTNLTKCNTDSVTVATSALPTGAATSAKQPALGTAGAASADVLTVQGAAGMTPMKVDGSGVTQPVSNASLPLPVGASTSAKQPALGTAGTPSADVQSFQGVSGGTPLAVGGQMTEIQNFPAVTASIYTAGNCLGAKQTLANAVRVAAGSGMIQSVLMTDKAKQNVNTTITFFSADPTSSTFTDKTAMTVNVADLTKIVATVTINSFVSYAGNSVGIATGLAIPFKLPSGTTLYAVAMTNGTPTPASTSDVTFIYEILWD